MYNSNPIQYPALPQNSWCLDHMITVCMQAPVRAKRWMPNSLQSYTNNRKRLSVPSSVCLCHGLSEH